MLSDIGSGIAIGFFGLFTLGCLFGFACDLARWLAERRQPNTFSPPPDPLEALWLLPSKEARRRMSAPGDDNSR